MATAGVAMQDTHPADIAHPADITHPVGVVEVVVAVTTVTTAMTATGGVLFEPGLIACLQAWLSFVFFGAYM